MNVFVNLAMKKFNNQRKANVKILMNVFVFHILVVKIPYVSIRMAISNVHVKKVSLEMQQVDVNLLVIQYNVVNMQPVTLMVKKLPVFVIQDLLLIRAISAPDVWILMNVMLIMVLQDSADKVLSVRILLEVIIATVPLVLVGILSVIVKIWMNVIVDMGNMESVVKMPSVQIGRASCRERV